MGKLILFLNLILCNCCQTIHGCIEYQFWQSDLLNEHKLSEKEIIQTPRIINTLDSPEINTTQVSNPLTNKFTSFCLFYQIYWQSNLENLDEDFNSIMNLVTNSSFANFDTIYFDQRIYINGHPTKPRLIENKLSEIVSSFFNVSIEEKILEYDKSLDLEYWMSANMIFRIHPQSRRIGILCYFCLHDKIKWLSFQDQQSFEAQLGHVFRNLVPGPLIINDGVPSARESVTNPICRSQKYSHGKYACVTGQLDVAIVAEKLNMTIVEGPDGATLPVSPGLHVCTACEGGMYNAFNPVMNAKLFFRDGVNFKILYCYYELPSESAKFTNLLKPYDKYIWIMLIITLIVYSTIYRNPCMGFSLFGFLLNQGVDKKFCKTISVGLLLLTVITNAYLSVVTTDLVKPLRPKLYETYGEMYNSTNFRFLFQNRIHIQMAASYFSKLFPKYKNMMEMKILDSFRVVHLYSKPFQTPHTLAKEMGATFTALDKAFPFTPFQQRNGEYRFTNVTCAFVVQESQYYPFFKIIRLHHSKEALYYLYLLSQSGVDSYWRNIKDRLQKADVFKKASERNITRQDLFSYRNPKPLSLDSMLKIVFLLHLIMTCVGMIVGFVELRQFMKAFVLILLKGFKILGQKLSCCLKEE